MSIRTFYIKTNRLVFGVIDLCKKKIVKFVQSTFFDRFVIMLIVLCGLFWFGVTYFQYQEFAYRTGDTPVAEQAIWNTVHGRYFYQSFLQTETNFREHLNFIQILYVPLYAIFPHTLTLFFIIQLSIVTAAIYLYYFVKKRLNIIAAVTAVGLWMFHPIIASQAVGDMHVVSVAGPAFLILLLSYHDRQYKQFIFWTVFFSLISEFVAPTIFLVGVLAFFEGRGWRWFAPPVAGGLAMYLAAKYYITIGFGSNANIISKFTPKALMSIYKIEKRLDFVSMSLAPLLWVFPWISRYALLLIPSIMIAIFIIIPGRIDGGQHVFIMIPAILVIIFIDLMERFKKYERWIIAMAVFGMIFSLQAWWDWMHIDGSDYTKEMNRAVAAVKDGGSLTASTQFGPKVCRREEFFLPFNDKMTDYVVLKTSKNRESAKELENQELKYDQKIELSGLYRTVYREGRIVVYVKIEKITDLLQISAEELDLISDVQLAEKWKTIELE